VLQATEVQPLRKMIPGASVDSTAPSTSWLYRAQELDQDQRTSTLSLASSSEIPFSGSHRRQAHDCPVPQCGETDPLYLFACHVEWERREEPSAAWELLAAGQSSNQETRAHARALLASSHHLNGAGMSTPATFSCFRKCTSHPESEMKAPYGLEIVDNCTECGHLNPAYFCAVSAPALRSLDAISHKSTLPSGAILFVEGQAPRGLFIVCAGKVNLSTTSREGKILILKTVEAGGTVGLSATISGMPYEVTAETSTPCQLGFVNTKHFTELMDAHSEIGVHTAHCLSREYQSAYRDIHGLVLTRSSAGKLARLLLSQAPPRDAEDETRVQTPMTHEEMAQRIGASRETVTRLLSHLRKKHLIRLDGPTLVIRDRSGLEALTT
jgi:CRP/FNR family transcriptional regulator, cyclic AMP receptor protein